jgi:hypothetical protein
VGEETPVPGGDAGRGGQELWGQGEALKDCGGGRGHRICVHGQIGGYGENTYDISLSHLSIYIYLTAATDPDQANDQDGTANTAQDSHHDHTQC